MKKRLLSLILSAAITSAFVPCITTAQADGAILAFPGAEGAGKYAIDSLENMKPLCAAAE